ncbi:hypothetical protein DdX_17070 [Ditylenchus destructor]|uniref:Uncharacterized protein n=1 Tax=Ditylenchus destructor TaxID=166010 RepID=A0AAD4QZG8_9BILA|nr:hypothetical protein DdX_17070 [Ditylenchus destructor]
MEIFYFRLDHTFLQSLKSIFIEFQVTVRPGRQPADQRVFLATLHIKSGMQGSDLFKMVEDSLGGLRTRSNVGGRHFGSILEDMSFYAPPSSYKEVNAESVLDENIVTDELRVNADLFFHVHTMDDKPITFDKSEYSLAQARFGDGFTAFYEGGLFRNGFVEFEENGEKVRRYSRGLKSVEVVAGKTGKRTQLYDPTGRPPYVGILAMDQLYEAKDGIGKIYVELDLYD